MADTGEELPKPCVMEKEPCPELEFSFNGCKRTNKEEREIVEKIIVYEDTEGEKKNPKIVINQCDISPAIGLDVDMESNKTGEIPKKRSFLFADFNERYIERKKEIEERKVQEMSDFSQEKHPNLLKRRNDGKVCKSNFYAQAYDHEEIPNLELNAQP